MQLTSSLLSINFITWDRDVQLIRFCISPRNTTILPTNFIRQLTARGQLYHRGLFWCCGLSKPKEGNFSTKDFFGAQWQFCCQPTLASWQFYHRGHFCSLWLSRSPADNVNKNISSFLNDNFVASRQILLAGLWTSNDNNSYTTVTASIGHSDRGSPRPTQVCSNGGVWCIRNFIPSFHVLVPGTGRGFKNPPLLQAKSLWPIGSASWTKSVKRQFVLWMTCWHFKYFVTYYSNLDYRAKT